MMAAMSLIKRVARVMLGAAGSLPVKRERKSRTATGKANQSAVEAYSKLPLRFEARPNKSPAKFVSRASGYNFYLSATEAVFQLQVGQSVR